MNKTTKILTIQDISCYGQCSITVALPVISAATQVFSMKLSQSISGQNNNGNDQMASTMKTMNTTMPLLSLFMVTTLPTGIGVYWIFSAVVRIVQQFFINKSLKKMSIEELIEKNKAKAMNVAWWGGSTSIPAYVDLFHLYPSEADANQAKSNYPLGEVVTATFDNGVVKVGYATTGQGGGASKVFEPNEEYVGDFARTYFYVVTCYQNLTWATKYMYMLEQNNYPTLKPGLSICC